MTEQRTYETGPWRLCQEGDGRTIEARAVPYSTPVRIGALSEQVAPGAVDVPGLVGVPLLWRHDEPVGVVTAAVDDPAGPLVQARVSNTSRGSEALELVADGAVRGVSIGFDPVLADRDASSITHTLIDVREISLTPLPAYRDAAVLSLREREPMTDTMQAAAPVTADTTPDLGRELALTSGQVAELRERLAALEAAPATATHPLAQYRTLTDYVRAVKDGSETRAWVDQITHDNPGVVPPAWLTEIRGIVDLGRPAVEGTGGALTAPAAGMSVNFPYFDGDLQALVGVQATEKTEITSVKVPIAKGVADLKTYAGGSDLSLQLIERSEPSYLEAYLRIMFAAYAAVTEKAFEGAGFDAAGAGSALVKADAGNPDKLRAWLHTANLAVGDATGAPASVVAMSKDLFLAAAGAAIPPGTGYFVSPDLPRIVRAPYLADGQAFATNGQALRWIEDGPRSIADDVVAKLGRDVAVYGFATASAFVPKGIYKNAAVTP